VRAFVDLALLDPEALSDLGGLEPVAKLMGFSRILTLSDVQPIDGKALSAQALSTEVHRAKSAGKIPLVLATTAESLKHAARFRGILVELRTRADMQFATIARDRGVLPVITLEFLRAHPKNIATAAQNVVLLHCARIPFVLSTGARAPTDLRGPWEIAAVGRALGLPLPLALSAVSTNWSVLQGVLP